MADFSNGSSFLFIMTNWMHIWYWSKVICSQVFQECLGHVLLVLSLTWCLKTSLSEMFEIAIIAHNCFSCKFSWGIKWHPEHSLCSMFWSLILLSMHGNAFLYWTGLHLLGTFSAFSMSWNLCVSVFFLNNLAINIYTQSTLSMIYPPLQQSLVSSVAKYD